MDCLKLLELELIHKFLGSVRVSPHLRIVNIQERRFIAEKGLHLRTADRGVCLNLQVDESAILSLSSNYVTSKACTYPDSSSMPASPQRPVCFSPT